MLVLSLKTPMGRVLLRTSLKTFLWHLLRSSLRHFTAFGYYGLPFICTLLSKGTCFYYTVCTVDSYQSLLSLIFGPFSLPYQ